MEGESDRDYELFKEYYMMGEDRSIKALSTSSFISNRQLIHIAKQFQWRERIAKDTELENLKIKADFARNQKENFEKKLRTVRETQMKVQEIQNILNFKADQYIKSDLEPEIYFKRSNQYLNLILKLQKIEKNFNEKIENYDLEEDVELDELEDELERFGDNEMTLGELRSRIEQTQSKELSENYRELAEADTTEEKNKLLENSDI